jgi:hypothetical protein
MDDKSTREIYEAEFGVAADLTPTIKYAFAGDNGAGTISRDWSRHLFDTEEKARGFGGRWKGSVVRVEVRALSSERVDGDVDFYPRDIYPDSEE